MTPELEEYTRGFFQDLIEDSFILPSVYQLATGEMLWSGNETSKILAAAGFIPYGIGKNLGRTGKALRHTPDQRALLELADEASLLGHRALSVDDARTIMEWARELELPGARALADDVASPSNWRANPVPHIHIPGAGRNGKIPIEPGLEPFD